MPHTPFVGMLRRAMRAAGEASIRNVETKRVLEARALRTTSRREFLARTSGAALAAVTASSLLAKPPSGNSANVVVIGAGLSGLTCAYRLKQAGINATIYEANTRIGGRCWTRRGDFV